MKFNKSLSLIVLTFVGCISSSQLFGQIVHKVGSNVNSINQNSILELEATNKGVLFPRVNLSATNLATPLSAFVEGMTVYNKATAGSGNTAVSPGFYYSDGSKWIRIDGDGAGTKVSAGTNVTISGVGTVASPYVVNAAGAADATTTTNGIVRLAGDLSGTAAAPSVVKLQGQAVSVTVPTTNQALVWNGTSWAPSTLTSTNIYNTDGTLTGNRVISGGVNNLTLQSSNVNGGFTIEHTSGAVGTKPSLLNFNRYHTSGTAVRSNQTIGKMNFNGYDGTAMKTTASIYVEADSSFSSTNSSSELVFSTTERGTTLLTQRMKIADNGNVSIGDVGGAGNSATERLQVNGNVRFSGALMPNNSAGTAGQVLTSAGSGVAPIWQNPSIFTDNIYNTDGTLTNDRTLSCGNNTFTIKTTNLNRCLEIEHISSAVVSKPSFINFSRYFGGFTAVPSRVTLGRMNFSGYNGTDMITSASIVVESDSAFTSTNSSSEIVFSTTERGTTTITQRMKIADNGNVSIGDVGGAGNSATQKLQVNGNIRFSGALMPNNLAGTAGQVLTSAGAGVAPTWQYADNIYNTDGTLTGNRIIIGGANNLTLQSSNVDGGFTIEHTSAAIGTKPSLLNFNRYHTGGTAVLSTQTIGKMNFNGYDGTAMKTSASIYVEADSSFSSTNSSSELVFATTERGTTLLTQRMKIADNGNVSIGDVGGTGISATERLQVNGNVRFSGALMPNNLAGTAGQVLTSAGAGASPTWSTILTTEVDGIIGNEVTDATVSGGLSRSGLGTAVSPYTLGIATGGIASTMLADGSVTAAKMSAGAGTAGRIPVANALGTITYTDASSVINNLYSADGTLSGNRLVTQGTNSLAFTSTATTGTSHFSVDGTTFNINAVTNRIGIGTASPNVALSIVNNGLGAGGADDIELASYNASGAAPTIFIRSSRGSQDSPASAVNGDLIGNIIFTPRGASNFLTSGYISSFYRGNGTTNLSDLLFATSGTSRMTISETGTVLINNLAGVGSRMVVADATGVLSTQTLPTNTNIYNTDGTLTGNRIISGGSNNLTLQSSNVNGGFTIEHTSGAIGTKPSLLNFNRYHTGGTAVISAQTIGKMNFNGYDGTAMKTSASIYVEADSSFSSTNSSSELVFATTERGTTLLTQRMKIADNGNVSIGDVGGAGNSATERLQVNGNVRFSGALMPNNLAGTAGQVLTSAGVGVAPTWSNVYVSSNNLGVGVSSPTSTIQSNGTFALNTATSGTANSVVLLASGTFNPPTASTVSGRIYIIRNTSAATNVTVASVIDYGATSAASFTLTPALGSIMIISDGTSWFRIQ